MSIHKSAQIHPTAVISPEANISEDVQIGPFVVIEGPVQIGRGCIIKANAFLRGPLKMGQDNTVFQGVVLGERPQSLRYNDEETSVEIGDGNIFREYMTVHRGTNESWVTRIGNHNFFMACSHVGHDCQIGNRCMLANGALLGGHVKIQDNVLISGNAAVHQFCRVGRLALLSGCSTTTKDIPPFVVQQEWDAVFGINVIGMRRVGISNQEINLVRQAFRIIFREKVPLPAALERVEAELGQGECVQEMVAFLKGPGRGINIMRGRSRKAA